MTIVAAFGLVVVSCKKSGIPNNFRIEGKYRNKEGIGRRKIMEGGFNSGRRKS